jgi:TPR repeat protein
MLRLLRTALIALTLVYSGSTANAADFEKGLAAAQAGDFITALREWRPLAQQGNAAAQNHLGYMYDAGQGVPKDDAEALRWYRLSAHQGYANAQSNLGHMLRIGQGVLKDDVAASYWYRLAAEQGHTNAQNSLGYMYEIGAGVLKDRVFAYMWYNISSANGNEFAPQNRDEIEATMTPGQVAEATNRARACMVSNYQDCD